MGYIASQRASYIPNEYTPNIPQYASGKTQPPSEEQRLALAYEWMKWQNNIWRKYKQKQWSA